MQTKNELKLTNKELINLYQGVKRLMDNHQYKLAFIMSKNISKYLDTEDLKIKSLKKRT